MKLTQIDNACCVYEVNGFKFLCDPWLTDGAFEGSWHHYPPLVTTFEDVKDVDALYISHIHPDHFDEEILKKFRKDIPTIVLDHGVNFLHKKLLNIGLTNLIKVKDSETITLGPLEITVYAPFVKHPFDNSELGNFIDSALVVEANGKVVLNANDNTPSVESARLLHSRHGKFSVVQLKDSLAGAYPSCFLNLSHEEKLAEANKLIKRQIDAMCEVAKVLEADWFQPFAGDYQLGGKLVTKNQYLGVAGKLYTANIIASKGIKPLVLSEKSSIDLITNEVVSAYRKNVISYDKWTTEVSKVKFAWDNDPIPCPKEIRELAFKARENLSRMQTKLNYKPNYNIVIRLTDDPIWPSFYSFNLDESEHHYYLGGLLKDTHDLECYLDPRLLKRILTKESHWNNAEVGCHIDFDRKGPYNPDVHMIMSFFHV